MAFFKTTRDQLKGNALVSHLEFANQFVKPADMIRCQHHIRSAQKALITFRAADAEYIFSDEGWHYLYTLTEPLQIALRMGGYNQLASDVEHIVDYVNRVLAQRGITVEPLLANPPAKKVAVFGCLAARTEELLDSAVSCADQNDNDGVARLFRTNSVMEVCQGTRIEIKEQKPDGKALIAIKGFDGDFWTLLSYTQDE